MLGLAISMIVVGVLPTQALVVPLHLSDPRASPELTSYLEQRRCNLPLPFDDAPKLAHSIAIELEDALDSAQLPIGTSRVFGLTIIISEVDDMDAAEACLSAFGFPESATLSDRDFEKLRMRGMCAGEDAGEDAGDDDTTLTLISGEKIAGFRPAPDELQQVLDATAVLADELDEHFEFSVSGPGCCPIVYGGRAPDGCIVGVLGMR